MLSDTINSAASCLSLKSYSSRRQFAVALALTSVIPLLLVWLVASHLQSQSDWTAITWETAGIVLCIATLMALGILILTHYVSNIAKLRRALEQLVRGEYPEAVELVNCADDVQAIQNALNVLVGRKREQLLATERRRVMVESLNTACHHFGQPLAVLSCCIDILNKDISDPESRQLIKLASEAVGSLLDTIDQFKDTTEYKTEPYWQSMTDPDAISKARILTI